MKRIYKVETVVQVDGKVHKTTRLINASTRAQACKKGVDAIVTGIVASQADCISLAKAGVEVEEAGGEG